ncbi:MAG: VanZ family protein, partial [Chloroflexi bacterium]|nr:VanZ family protein [Chloroflexota bacterium]
PPLPDLGTQPLWSTQTGAFTANNLLAKGIHLAQYAILAALFYLPLNGNARAWVTAFVLASLYGASDEWHQSFVATRQGSLNDWLIDSASALGALALLFAVQQLKRSRLDAKVSIEPEV